jgi:hypothetical protein
VAGSREHCNKYSSSIKGGEFLNQLKLLNDGYAPWSWVSFSWDVDVLSQIFLKETFGNGVLSHRFPPNSW